MVLTKRGTKSIVLIVRLSWSSRSGVQTPPSFKWLGHLSGLAELQVTSFLGHDGALVFWCELRDESCDEPAGLLGIEVTDLLRDIHN